MIIELRLIRNTNVGAKFSLIILPLHLYKNYYDYNMAMRLQLDNIGKYYTRNHLCANSGKTQTCVFHIRNREANRILRSFGASKILELDLTQRHQLFLTEHSDIILTSKRSD